MLAAQQNCRPMFVTVPMDLTPVSVVSTTAVAEAMDAYSASKTYEVGERVIDGNRIREATKEGKLQKPSEQEGATPEWLYVMATNPYRMIDERIETQTVAESPLVVEIQAVGLVNVVAMMNVDAATVRVEVIDAVEGVVYDSTQIMGDYGASNLWEWLFKPFRIKRDALFSDLPTYGNALIRITIDNALENAAVGHLTVGTQTELGKPRAGFEVGIMDFSRKERDDFGNMRIVRRSYSKLSSYSLVIDTSRVDEVHRTLADLRGKLVFWQGVESIDATSVFGFYNDFNITVPGRQVSECRLHIEGII